MNYTANPTAAALITAARELFARLGYDAASVRAITTRAGVNLGAVTYHFGSKEALYEAVIESALGPSRQRLRGAAAGAGPPLERLEAAVRAFFAFLYESPDLPRLMLQQLASARPISDVVLEVMRDNIRLVASLIVEGQKDGSIRAGDPQLMALSIGSQPIWLSLARRALQAGVAIDQDDPQTRAQLVESVVGFVRAGLAANSESER
ncbi:MAG: TetR/AcrR family transcriptional regulator [Gemmatimonadales bacterium]|jgi:AcrR family transcriptional regulator